MAMQINRNQNLKGIGLMIFGMVGLAGTDVLGKWLMIEGYSAFQVIAVKGWIIVVLMTVWILLTRRISQIKTSRAGAHGLRLVLTCSGPILILIALAEMPLADVTVIVFSSVFITTAMSAPIFKEKVGFHRWAAVIIGFAGVVLVLRPGIGVFQPVGILALLAGAAFAALNLTTRWLRDTETTLSLIFYIMLGMAALSSLILPFVWKPISFLDLMIYTVMAVFTLIGYIGMTGAFMCAPLGVVAPFEYTLMLFAVVSGYLIWEEIPDRFVWTGATIILMSGIYLIQREARAHGVIKKNNRLEKS